MPELPEVESIVRRLSKTLKGKVIQSATVQWPKTIHTSSPTLFTKNIEGCAIIKISRRGKFIVIELSKNSNRRVSSTQHLYLLTHLRMSGRLYACKTSAPVSSHERVTLHLDGGIDLRFNDIRKFGRMWLVNNTNKVLASIGQEPLDVNFNSTRLSELVLKRNKCIKALLLDQSVIAGIGNIYADESLWLSRIHPLTKSSKLKPAQIESLRNAIQCVLKKAISDNGTDFGDGVIKEGKHSPKVYGREGLECLRCGSTIRKTRVGQRGTHFCPRCQKR